VAEETDIEEEIAEDAAHAASVSVDGTTTTEHSLPDKIAADKYLRANRAMNNAGAGVVFQKIVPHGSVS
jgi:hypothetical protein